MFFSAFVLFSHTNVQMSEGMFCRVAVHIYMRLVFFIFALFNICKMSEILKTTSARLRFYNSLKFLKVL